MKKKKKTKKPTTFHSKLKEVKKIKATDVLVILVLITAILFILGLVVKIDLLSVFASKIDFDLNYYFDIFVRNGIFKIIYFALIINLSYLIGKHICGKRFNVKTGLISILLGFIIACFIYQLPPYYLPKAEPMPGDFNKYPSEEDIREINHLRCEKRIDFLFSPHSDIGLKVIPEIEYLINKGISINVYCIGDSWINNNILCKEKYGLDPRAGSKLRKEYEISLKESYSPYLVINCKYKIKAYLNSTVIEKLICNMSELC